MTEKVKEAKGLLKSRVLNPDPTLSGCRFDRFDGLTALTHRPIDRLRVVRKIEPPCSESW